MFYRKRIIHTPPLVFFPPSLFSLLPLPSKQPLPLHDFFPTTKRIKANSKIYL